MATPTRGQVERTLSQKIQAVYREHLGHSPSKVTCQLFDEKVAIVVENSVTQPEQLLIEEGQVDRVERLQLDLKEAIRPKLKQAIATVLNVEVLDLLSEAALESGRTGMIAVLSSAPDLREGASVQKARISMPISSTSS
jgi:uncharacterized protein YbcI